jgi:hypothetical protein
MRKLYTFACLTAVACGGSTTSPGPTTNPPTQTPAGFNGTYATRVTLASNTCGTINVQDNPTIVAHDASAGTVTFTHAGFVYSGTVKSDSTFTTTPRAVNVNDGFNYSIAITGRFRPLALDADATVDRTGGSAACRYVVHWAGTR